jgi:hypothetical protein
MAEPPEEKKLVHMHVSQDFISLIDPAAKFLFGQNRETGEARIYYDPHIVDIKEVTGAACSGGNIVSADQLTLVQMESTTEETDAPCCWYIFCCGHIICITCP